MKLEIKFGDLSYVDKRSKYRNYAAKNSFAYEMKLLIIDEILSDYSKEILPEIQTEHLLNIILTDGYVACERIFNDKQTKIEFYKFIDPVTLTVSSPEFWIQYNDNESMKRVLSTDQILFLKYPILDANDSFIGQIYTKQIELVQDKKMNDFMISYIIKKIKIQLDELIENEKNFFKKK